MRISDWSSDVCSSDLLLSRYADSGRDCHLVLRLRSRNTRPTRHSCTLLVWRHAVPLRVASPHPACSCHLRRCARINREDRKSVVKGKSVSVRVDIGGRRNIQKTSANKNLIDSGSSAVLQKKE